MGGPSGFLRGRDVGKKTTLSKVGKHRVKVKEKQREQSKGKVSRKKKGGPVLELGETP